MATRFLARVFLKMCPRVMRNILPDDQYLKLRYRARTGRKLNLDNPQTFNEKLQWLKLYDRKPEYTSMVDKYEAKLYAAEQIGEDHIIPTFGVWDRFEDIDFDQLPNQFVLKCTHDSGGLIICRDKSSLDLKKASDKINKSLNTDYYYSNREWPYKNVKKRILAEQYMEDENETSGLRDYKFFCFNNEPKMVYLSEGLEDHATAKISFFDLNGNEMPFHRSDYRQISEGVVFPSNFDEMVVMARNIAEKVDCPFVRVDLYSIHGKIYFSEITFSPCAGMIPFDPPEWDEKIGDWIKLPIKK